MMMWCSGMDTQVVVRPLLDKVEKNTQESALRKIAFPHVRTKPVTRKRENIFFRKSWLFPWQHTYRVCPLQRNLISCAKKAGLMLFQFPEHLELWRLGESDGHGEENTNTHRNTWRGWAVNRQKSWHVQHTETVQETINIGLSNRAQTFMPHVQLSEVPLDSPRVE